MDTNNSTTWSTATMPDQGEFSVDMDDWRTQLQPETRQRYVNMILETLKRHFPCSFSGEEELFELKKIAIRFEDKIYASARTQSDYLWKVSLKNLSMEGGLQSTNALPSESADSSIRLACVVSENQISHDLEDDWQETIHRKIKAMKGLNLPELNEIYQHIIARLQQVDSLLQQPKVEQLDKLITFKTILERTIALLLVSRNNTLPGYKENLASYEKWMRNFLAANRPRKQVASIDPYVDSRQEPLPKISEGQSHGNQMKLQVPSTNIQDSVVVMQRRNMHSQQHMSSIPLFGVPICRQNNSTLVKPESGLDSEQGPASKSLEHFAVGNLQHNHMKVPQQTKVNMFSPGAGRTPAKCLFPSVKFQYEEQQFLQTQLMEQQLEQLKLLHDLVHRQLTLQHEQQQQHLSKQLQPHQINDCSNTQQLLSLNTDLNNSVSGDVQRTVGLPSDVTPAQGATLPPLSNTIDQNSNIQNVSQNSAMNPMGQGLPSSTAVSSQRLMHRIGKVPHQLLPWQQQQQILIQQQLHKELPLKTKKKKEQQQQNLSQPTKLQFSQQSGTQAISVEERSFVQSNCLPDLQQQQLQTTGTHQQQPQQQQQQVVTQYSSDLSKKTDEHCISVLHQLKNRLQQELLVKNESSIPEASSYVMPHLLSSLLLFMVLLWLYALYA